MYEFIINLSNDMYLPALPKLCASLDVSTFWAKLTITVWFLGAMLMNPLLGSYADYVSRKKILFYSGIIFIISCLYCAVSSNIILFLLARFFQGLAVTSVVVSGYALIHDYYSDQQAIHIISWLSAILIIAPMTGPVMGGYIIANIGWREIFIIVAVIASIALMGIQITMKTDKVKEIQFRGVMAEITIYKNIIMSFRFVFGCLTSGFVFGIIIAWITLSPFIIISEHHYSPLAYGIYQIPIFASFIIGVTLQNTLHRYCKRQVTPVAIGISMLAITALLFIYFIHDMSLSTLVLLMSCVGLSSGIMSSTINRLTVMSLNYGTGKQIAIFDFIVNFLGVVGSIMVNLHQFDSIVLIAYVTIGFIVFAMSSYFIWLLSLAKYSVKKHLH